MKKGLRPAVEALETRNHPGNLGAAWWPIEADPGWTARISPGPVVDRLGPDDWAYDDARLPPWVNERTYHMHQDALTLLAATSDLGEEALAADPDETMARRLRSVYRDHDALLDPLRQASLDAVSHVLDLVAAGVSASRVNAARVRSEGISARYHEAATNRDRLRDLENVSAEDAVATARRVARVLEQRLDTLSASVTQTRHRLDVLESQGVTGRAHTEASRDYRVAAERHYEAARVLAELNRAFRGPDQ